MSRTIKTVDEYVREIIKISDDNGKNTTVFYRGETRDFGKSSCRPVVFRKESYISNEHKLFKEYISYNPNEFEKEKLTIDKLSKMQHYGLPTRLLDLTNNALVALYMSLSFSSYSKECNSIVYIFEIPNDIIKFHDSDTVSVIANLAKREKFVIKDHHSKRIDEFNNTEDAKFLLHDIKDEKPYFRDLIDPRHLSSIVCIQPLKNNRRIINQQGQFLLFGDSRIKKYEPASLEDSNIERYKLIIDAKCKKKIKTDLKQLGITHAFVYPELSEISDYLKEKYC